MLPRDCAARALSHVLLRLPVHTVADCIHNSDLAVRRPRAARCFVPCELRPVSGQALQEA